MSSLENVISLKMSDEDHRAIKQAIQVLETKLLPHLITMTSQDKRKVAKVSDKSYPFIEKVIDYCENDQEFVPKYLDVGELKRDFHAVQILRSFHRPMQQVMESIEDSITLAGAEAYTASLTYYNSVKQGAKVNIHGAKSIYEDLKTRFQKSRVAQPKSSDDSELE